MVLHTLGWLFLPVSRTHKHTRTQEDIVIKRRDGCVPVAEVVCALWLLTDVGAAFRKHCSQNGVSAIYQADYQSPPSTALPPVSPNIAYLQWALDSSCLGEKKIVLKDLKNFVTSLFPLIFSYYFSFLFFFHCVTHKSCC